ncbi:MAG: hypothetical protein QXH60_03105, partial [Candidatus Pacearchaeota archaeon]
MEEENKQETIKEKAKTNYKEKFENIYNKNYKILIYIPVILLILTLGYLFYFSSINGDIIKKDITLTGGTSIQVFAKTDINQLKAKLNKNEGQFSIREISDITTGEQV